MIPRITEGMRKPEEIKIELFVEAGHLILMMRMLVARLYS